MAWAAAERERSVNAARRRVHEAVRVKGADMAGIIISEAQRSSRLRHRPSAKNAGRMEDGAPVRQ